MTILGFYVGHDAAVSLIKDGKVVFNLQEERPAKIKHCSTLPVNALRECFKITRISPSDIDYVAVPIIGKIPEIRSLFNDKETELIDKDAQFGGFRDTVRKNILLLYSYVTLFNKFGFPNYFEKYQLKKSAKILQLDHHTAHASSAYYTSGYDNCLVVTADGVGNALSLTIWLGRDGKLTNLARVWRNGSLGFMYGIVTEALGWQVDEGEGKTMGLAPYGKTDKTKGVLDFITPRYKDGKLVKGVSYKIARSFGMNGLTLWHYPESEKVASLIQRYGRENIAAEVQRVLEMQILNFLKPWILKYKIRKLAAAGGVFLNVKMNQRILETGLLDDLFIYPDAGDAGLPLGSALYIHHLFSKKRYQPKRIINTHWGPSYSDVYIENLLKIRHVKYKKYSNLTKLTRDTAVLLASNNIVGWFQGKTEAGPRALGNRSILMDPRKAKNKDILNSKVKYREAFRPFCPSMTEEAAKIYLDKPTKAEFMTISFNVPKDVRKKIPAVVHVDGTARPQIVTKDANRLYYELIEEFGKITGVPVILNTSFNIRGQPIVCSPGDAIKCFFDTGLDILVMGSFLIKK